MDQQTNNIQENYGSRLQKIHSAEFLDQKFGFQRYTDIEWKDAWLLNVQSAEMIDEQTKNIIAVCDFYFIQEDGGRFKISYPFRPYLYIATLPSFEHQVLSYLSKKYASIITTNIVEKEDLDLKNHLSGLKRTYLKISFPSLSELLKFKKDITPILKRNQEREKQTTSYTNLLTRHFGLQEVLSDEGGVLEKIIDLREHDLPYQMRVCIDLEVFVGLWYRVTGRDLDRKPKITRHPTLIDPPEPVVLAYDIEVTKLPLKFPDSSFDEIMMISYMVNGNGFLIINRQIISSDVDDFEYTPRPEYKGIFRVINLPDEKTVIKYFFDHIIRLRPTVFVTYNGDSFDWPFVEARAAVHNLNMQTEIGVSRNSSGEYRATNAVHLDAFKWVKRDSYLPVGSQNLKACTKAKLRYDPVELDPEQMCAMAKDEPQMLANYSVSDAVATYYLYIKYVHPFIFALCTIIPLGPDDVLRKGSGTLCEALLMVKAFQNNIIFPNKSLHYGTKYTTDGHVIESETYVGGHVEALESGVFRADIPEKFRIIPAAILDLKRDVRKTLSDSLIREFGVTMDEVIDFDKVVSKVETQLDDFIKRPLRLETPKIYHLDVGAMYPNIILTNRLQPSAVVTNEDCIACVYNSPEAKCQRTMRWEWRGEIMPASRGEYERILQQLENETFGKPPRAFHSLDYEQRVQIEAKRVKDFCKRAYGKTHITRNEYRYTTICERENAFYVDTVKSFRDRRYEYKAMLKKAKAVLDEVSEDDIHALKTAQGRIVLYESLQLAHKCILNSFYGYVMRKGARWFSMEMAGIVCHTGANIITEARKLVERIGKPLELDTDGIWCLIPGTFPENITFTLNSSKRKTVTVSYPGAILNALIHDKFTNNQFHQLEPDGTYSVTSENSIFFEVDGPYLAMILPASREEGKKLKKRYAVFNFDGSLAELKGFEVKRRGELALIKYFQSSVFKAFLKGESRAEAYEHAAKEANYWLDVLFSKGASLPDYELFDLIAENRSMSKKLDDYGEQKSTSISTAKRLAEFLGDDMVKDVGLACRFIISKMPLDAPVAQRAIPLAIFQATPNVCAHYLRKWTKDTKITKDNIDIRNIIDWEYYIERFGATIQKIISIPAALQNVPNPVPRVPFPDWLENKRQQRKNDHKQPKINEIFKKTAAPAFTPDIESISISRATNYSSLDNVTFFNDSQNLEKGSISIQKTDRWMVIQKKTIVEHGVEEWLRYLKAKWKKEREEKKRKRQNALSKGITPIISVLERGKQMMQDTVWQIIKISETPSKGLMVLWCIILDKMVKLNVRMPRIIYVNNREENGNSGILVKRILPRLKPVFNLRRYVIDERIFESSLNQLNKELCAMRIEGVYESQMPILFRAVLTLGCSCRLKPNFKTNSASTYDSEQLEPDFSVQYLPENSIRTLFFYEHQQDSRCVIAVFNTASSEAHIVVVNKTELNLPNLSNMYASEKTNLSSDVGVSFLNRKNDMNFIVSQCVTVERADRIIQRYIRNLHHVDSYPVMIAVQSRQQLSALVKRLPSLDNYPLVRIHACEPSGLFNVLDWQRIVLRRIIKHYFNMFLYLHQYVEVSRYLHVPIGNIPEDFSTFGPDVLFARSLINQGYVLWASPLSRPDLGGKELDDARLNAVWSSLSVNKQSICVVNESCLETDICVELELGAVDVTAIVQSASIADAEGGVDSVGFLTGTVLSADALLGYVRSIAQYDEGAAVAGPLKVLRLLLHDCIKDIHLYGNKIADQVIISLDRWLRTQHALMYDPAIVRVVDILITKLILLLVAELNRLGGRVIYASNSRLIMCTKRSSLEHAQSFVNSLLLSLEEHSIFASLNVKAIKFWDILLWIDTNDYIGILLGEEEEGNEVTVKLGTSNFIEGENYRNLFKQTLIGYLVLVARNVRSTNSVEEQQQYRLNLVGNEVTEQMFDFLNNLSLSSDIRENIDLRDSIILMVKGISHFIGLDCIVYESISKLRYQLLRMLDVNDASYDGTWQSLNVSCTLTQLFCTVCCQSNDLDICQSEAWICPSCGKHFDSFTIEQLLIERVNQLLIAYTIQDLKCTRCGAVRRHNLSLFCDCCGVEENIISPAELRFNLETIGKIAQQHDLMCLSELCEWTLF
ncbi:DNA polymerase family B, exonuclease domain containing protein [Brugia malayi]|uniref:DNA polymerase epsilon catalytic subunit n=1 Tax=Brugia malayi TaxID=6279 RepID=A0A1I9G5U6_BRUMA|nr:DNA polymerase family B, exonuclease domain containing protein [Brugia malayi]CDQ01959.1 Bm3809, isoform c [Brugia malayi]VIO96069.1 DNA polymerase family B, exonuclease domain containing protein [Brugia malayi]